jgi:hypothetical protein
MNKNLKSLVRISFMAIFILLGYKIITFNTGNKIIIYHLGVVIGVIGPLLSKRIFFKE